MQGTKPGPDPNKFDVGFVPPAGRAHRPRLYIIGEAPGRAEVVQRKPFVGHAGAVLHQLMTAAGIDISQVRLSNAVPFRPVARTGNGGKRNRRPTREEISRYSAVLFDDVRKSAPRAILAMGGSAMAAFGIPFPIKEARIREFEFEGIPLFITYHPQYIAYAGGEGGRIWSQIVTDLQRSWNRGAEASWIDRS